MEETRVECRSIDVYVHVAVGASYGVQPLSSQQLKERTRVTNSGKEKKGKGQRSTTQERNIQEANNIRNEK